MTKEERIADWKQMYDSFTNPEVREKAKREADKAKRIEQRKLDTGYVV